MANKTLVTLSIPNGGTDSPRLDLTNIRGMTIIAPAALTGTASVQAGTTQNSSAVFFTVQSPPGTDITLATSKATVLTRVPFPSMVIHSSSAEGAQRDFLVILEVGE